MLTIITNTNKLIIRKGKQMELKLVSFSTNVATTGKLYHGDELICHTFELPDRDNVQDISCVPAGTYRLKMVVSAKFGPSYEVKDVDGRLHILIHKGNTVHDTWGCILPCQSFGMIDVRGRKVFAGLSSKVAYDKLMALLGGEHHTIVIERN